MPFLSQFSPTPMRDEHMNNLYRNEEKLKLKKK